MKQVLAICGSKSKNSKSLYFLKLLKEQFLNYSDINFKIISPDDYYLSFVSGSNDMFIKGEDIDDIDDDGNFIKEEILNSEFIIVNSPVYSLNVSANIKNLIDRLSSWGHTFKLLGIPGITLSVSSGRGHLEVESYLDFMFSSFGMNIIRNLNFTNKEDIEQYNFKALKREIIEKIYSSKEFMPSLLQEQQFQEHKNLISKQPKHFYEYKYWEETGLLYSENLHEYVKNKNLLG